MAGKPRKHVAGKVRKCLGQKVRKCVARKLRKRLGQKGAEMRGRLHNACQQADGRAGPVPESSTHDKEDPRVDDDIASMK